MIKECERLEPLPKSDIRDFKRSAMPICEIDTSPYKSVASAYNSYRRSANGTGIKVCNRGNRVFLVKPDSDKQF